MASSTGEKQVSSQKYGRFGNENLIMSSRGNYNMMHAFELSSPYMWEYINMHVPKFMYVFAGGGGHNGDHDF